MNVGSQWRIELARPIGAAYARNPKVAAVMVGGSTSRGYADRYSDIEIGVFWHEAPTEEDRQAAAEASGAELHRLYPYDPDYEVWDDALFIGRAAPDQPGSGVLVEIPHYTVEFIDRTLADVVDRFDPSEDKQNLVAALGFAIPIKGEELFAEWRSRAVSYPRELAVAVVKRNAQIEFLWRTDMFLERGNNLMMLYDSFAQISKKLLHVLFGLNRIYYPGFKWVHLLIQQMNIAPVDFSQRLQRVFEAEPRIGADHLRSLVEETYTLIEREMPEIDVDRVRYFFRYRRQPWDEPPPQTWSD
jgi:hypothetical protein